MYGFFESRDKIYLIEELATDGDLFNQLQKQKNNKFSEKDSAKYIYDIALALEYLHRQGIIHRDIKPENILLTFNKAKLTDFGWSIYSPNNNLRDSFCGTEGYIAPEILNRKLYGNEVDIWSLGILIYELVFGKLPEQNDFEFLKRGQLNNNDKNNNQIKQISLELQDLLSLILKGQDRLTISEILQHKWFSLYK